MYNRGIKGWFGRGKLILFHSFFSVTNHAAKNVRVAK
jgi:hypothetical protein